MEVTCLFEVLDTMYTCLWQCSCTGYSGFRVIQLELFNMHLNANM